MSTQVFPTLAGLGWSVKRTPHWKTRVPESISGKRTLVADWSYPRYSWELTFDFLRQAGPNQQAASFQGQAWQEFAELAGFFNLRQGRGDSFLFTDQDDNTVSGQQVATGDGSTTQFQMLAGFGGFIMPILAPNATTDVSVNGVTQTPGSAYNVTLWGGAFELGGGASTLPPGTLNFATAPASGLAITASFSYYFPCQFDEDSLDFEKFMGALYNAKSVKFSSLK
jgi:uncharacterized protein (TIGR02217 family)